MSLRTDDSYQPNEKELRNLREKGTLCPIRNAFKTTNGIVIGKIIKMFPIVRKSKYQRSTILIVKLEDICKASRRIFKAMFADEAAELLDITCLEVNDYLSFFNKKLYKIPLYPDDSLPENECMKQFVIGVWPESSVQDVYYRRKTGGSWLPLKNTNSRACDAYSSRVDDSLADILEDDNDSSILIQDSAILRNEAVNSQLNDLNLKSPNKRIETIKMNENTTNKRVTGNIVKRFQINLVDINKTEKSRNQKSTESNQYEYVKLKDVEIGKKYNVYTILTKIVKKSSVTANLQYHMVITVMDDTKCDVNVTIFSRSPNGFPQFQPYSIVRFHRLQSHIYPGNDRLSLKSEAKDILVFDKSDISILYHVSKTFTLNDDERKKAEELRNWMLNNIASARPFTTLSTLDLNQRKINIRCEVVDKKTYVAPVIVLRIKDGTKGNVPVMQINFKIDEWLEALTAAKRNSEGEIEELDVIVIEPDNCFRNLKIGDHVELYNVEVSILQNFNKTKSYKWLKIHLKGCWENLKHFKPQENFNWHFNKDDDNSFYGPGTSGLPLRGQEKKRKLFNPDEIVDFQSDTENVETREKNAEKNIASSDTSGKNLKKQKCVDADIVNGPVSDKNTEEREQLNVAEDQIFVNETRIHEKVIINASTEDSYGSEIILSQTESSVEKNCDNTMYRNSNNDISIENNEAQDQISSSPEIFMDALNTSKKRSNCNNLLEVVTNCEKMLNASQTLEEDGSNYLTQWPETSNDVFNIRVQLIATNPIVNAYSSEADILSIINSYCEKCFQMFTYHQWIHVSDEEIGVCLNCKKEGRFLILLELLLRDRSGDAAWAVVLGKYAETFFDCKIDEIFTSAEVRSRIKKTIDSYSTHFRKKGPTLLVRIVPFDNDNERFKYHITNITLCDP